jgi:hypothetical protein
MNFYEKIKYNIDNYQDTFKIKSIKEIQTIINIADICYSDELRTNYIVFDRSKINRLFRVIVIIKVTFVIHITNRKYIHIGSNKEISGLINNIFINYLDGYKLKSQMKKCIEYIFNLPIAEHLYSYIRDGEITI